MRARRYRHGLTTGRTTARSRARRSRSRYPPRARDRSGPAASDSADGGECGTASFRAPRHQATGSSCTAWMTPSRLSGMSVEPVRGGEPRAVAMARVVAEDHPSPRSSSPARHRGHVVSLYADVVSRVWATGSLSAASCVTEITPTAFSMRVREDDRERYAPRCPVFRIVSIEEGDDLVGGRGPREGLRLRGPGVEVVADLLDNFSGRPPVPRPTSAISWPVPEKD